MKQGAEAFRPMPDYDEQSVPEKKEAVILPFPRKAQEYPEYKKSVEAALDYQEYKKLDGTLNQTEYQDVLERAASDTTLTDKKWSHYAISMANNADIAPLRSDVITYYGILCDRRQAPEKLSYADQGDHKLLTEALRIIGDKRSIRSLATFIEKLPHIFKKET